MKYSLIFQIFALCLVPSSIFAASAEEGGLVDHGGGGAFVSRDSSERLVSLDLFLGNQKIIDQENGDKLELSPQGKIDAGEWRDPRNFKGQIYLEKRLHLWKNIFPNLVGHIENIQKQVLPLILTSKNISSIANYSIPNDIYQNRQFTFLPGATFVNPPGIIFVDIELWNRAGLKSQGALLLHESLRVLQSKFLLSNTELQILVYMILVEEPANLPNFIAFDKCFTASGVCEYEQGSFRMKPVQPDKTSAKPEIRIAMEWKDLVNIRRPIPRYIPAAPTIESGICHPLLGWATDRTRGIPDRCPDQ